VRERKDMVVIYADLEEKNVPAFGPGTSIVPAQRLAGQQPGGLVA
jgi:hypothetical protein